VDNFFENGEGVIRNTYVFLMVVFVMIDEVIIDGRYAGEDRNTDPLKSRPENRFSEKLRILSVGFGGLRPPIRGFGGEPRIWSVRGPGSSFKRASCVRASGRAGGRVV
jgi:hypothetical protein